MSQFWLQTSLGQYYSVYGLLWVLVITCLGTFVAWFKSRRITKFMTTLPGPPVYPILGNLDGFLKRLWKEGNSGFLKHCDQLVSEYGWQRKILRVWACNRPIIALLDAEFIEPVLTSSEALEKAFPYYWLHPWLGSGLLTAPGSKWKDRRKLLTPAFHFRILEDFIPILNEQSMIMVKKMEECVEKRWVNIIPYITSCTLDIICETAMGVQIGAQKGQCPEYVSALYYVGEDFIQRAVRPWLWNNSLYTSLPVGKKYRESLDILHNFTTKVIREKKELLLKQRKGADIRDIANENVYLGVKERKSFLDLLLHYHIEQEALTETDIREEVDTFMFEGHDTTTAGIGWALYNIGLHPEVQKKVVEELNDIFGDDRERPVSPNDLKEMKYLECVLKESQRIYPSVPIIGRELRKDLPIPSKGMTIPKGVTIIMPVYYIHRNREAFPEPERFDPDRFLPQNSLNRSPFSFIPFSAGQRNCIGQKFAMMEEKTLVANILRHFTLHSVDSAADIIVLPELVLRSQNGIRLELRKRVTSST